MTLARAHNRDTVNNMKKMQTSRYRNSLIWEMKEDEYKPRQGSGLCDNSYARYSEKRFTQIYKALCVDAMLVSL